MEKALKISVIINIIMGITDIILAIIQKNHWQFFTGFTLIVIPYLMSDNLRLMKRIKTEMEINSIWIENYNNLIKEYIKDKE